MCFNLEVITFCAEALLHFAAAYWMIMLLYFVSRVITFWASSLLHFAPGIITFCATYYILRQYKDYCYSTFNLQKLQHFELNISALPDVWYQIKQLEHTHIILRTSISKSHTRLRLLWTKKYFRDRQKLTVYLAGFCEKFVWKKVLSSPPFF